MKKIHRKTKGNSIENKIDSSHLDTSVDNSIDEIFRFDDKLIGKRTNAIFEQKPIEDGFYEIELKSNMHSNFSLDSLNDSESLNIYNDDVISEIDEKKNEKMIRMVKEIEMEACQLTVNDLSGIEKLIEEDEDFSSEERNLHKKSIDDENNLSLIKVEKTFNQKQIPTVEKKNPPFPENSEDEISVDHEKSTKSRPGSKNKKEQKSPQNLKRNLIKGNNLSGRRKSKETSIGQKKNQLNAITNQTQKESTYQRIKREQLANGSSLKKVEKSVQRVKKNNSSLKIEGKRNKSYSPDQAKRRNPGAIYERKRVPTSYFSEDQEDANAKPAKFTVEIKIKPLNENYYCPFGMIRNTRYPQRFRIPPLRGWQNERRNQIDDRLSSITLIDDDYGREVQKTIRRQKQRIRN